MNLPICKPIKAITLLIVFSITLSSCFVTRTTIGNGPVYKEDTTSVYSKSKQFYLFLGLAALNKAQPKLPADPNYQIVSYMGFSDVLVTTFTFGILSVRTTKVLIRSK
jgi:hypothetical protein